MTGRFEIDTPLGTVLLEAGDTLLIGGLRYLSQEALEVRLATPISFDEAEFSIVLDPPWRRPPDERPEAEAPMPDVEAPEATLSTIQSDLRQVFTDTMTSSPATPSWPGVWPTDGGGFGTTRR
jgi:hypothetical protein